jgi:hypothetical protein
VERTEIAPFGQLAIGVASPPSCVVGQDQDEGVQVSIAALVFQARSVALFGR